MRENFIHTYSYINTQAKQHKPKLNHASGTETIRKNNNKNNKNNKTVFQHVFIKFLFVTFEIIILITTPTNKKQFYMEMMFGFIFHTRTKQKEKEKKI